MFNCRYIFTYKKKIKKKGGFKRQWWKLKWEEKRENTKKEKSKREKTRTFIFISFFWNGLWKISHLN